MIGAYLMKLPRLFGLLIFNLILIGIIYAIAPQQAPVTLYKLSLVTAAGLVGYWLDRTLFPYARPGEFLDYLEMHTQNSKVTYMKPFVKKGCEIIFATCLIRRAIIIGCAMLAMGLGA